jgi:hypothetical protein
MYPNEFFPTCIVVGNSSYEMFWQSSSKLIILEQNKWHLCISTPVSSPDVIINTCFDISFHTVIIYCAKFRI